MTEDINNLKISIVKIETKIDSIETTVGDIKDTLNKYIDKADSLYARKWVEDDVVWAKRLVVGAVIVALLGVVIATK